MYCNWCGSQLPADQAACPRCGLATTYNTSTPSPALAREGNSPQEAVLPSYAFGPIMEFGPDSTATQTQDPLQGTPYPPDAPPVPQSTLAYAAPLSAQAGLTASRPTTSIRRPVLSRRMIILLVVVAVCVIFSGIGLIYYAAIIQPAKLHTQATATAQAVAKAQARASATAYAHTPQGIFAQATGKRPLVSDSLANNNSGFWYVFNKSYGGCTFSNGAYHIRASAYNYGFYCSSTVEYTDFAFQVQMSILQGAGGGIRFHAFNQDAYRFGIEKDGSYVLNVIQNNNVTSTLASNHNSAIRAGLNQVNLLTVIMRGSNIYLYANKQFLTMVSDSTLTGGYFGLYADTDAYTNSADVAFTNETIWE